MKYIKLLSFALVLGFMSCDQDNDVEPIEPNANFRPNVNINLLFPEVNTITEGNQVFEYEVVLNEPSNKDITVHVTKVSGTAVNNDDYHASTVTVPAFSTSATGVIEIVQDDIAEETESVTLKIGNQETFNGTISESRMVTFNIENYVSNTLDFTYSWDHAFSIESEDFDAADVIDFDIYLYDASYTDAGNYDAATGASPEQMSLDLDTLADGTYYLVLNMWASDGVNGNNLNTLYHDPFFAPLTIDYIRGGVVSGTFVQEESQWWKSTDAPDPSGATVTYIATVIIDNGTFVIEDSSNTEIASGRQANTVK